MEGYFFFLNVFFFLFFSSFFFSFFCFKFSPYRFGTGLRTIRSGGNGVWTGNGKKAAKL